MPCRGRLVIGATPFSGHGTHAHEGSRFRHPEARRARSPGQGIHHALAGLGFAGVNDVRAGKLIELDVDEGTSDADIEAMCRQLLANTVIENFKIERSDAPRLGSGQA